MPGADFERIILTLTARKRLPCNGPLKVQQNKVALLDHFTTFDRLQTSMSFLQPTQRLVDLSVRNRDFHLLDFHAQIVFDFEVGLHFKNCRKKKRAPSLKSAVSTSGRETICKPRSFTISSKDSSTR